MKRESIETFGQAVEYLYRVPRFTTKNTIEDTRAYLKKMGSPDKSLKVIHVAGTNGKGSVCAYMRYILEAAGYKTAVFTSPHLVDIRERFLINGKMVEEQVFLEAFLTIYNSLDWESIKEGKRSYHPTFFEYLFLMAMLIFKDAEVDYCILETGLGGRLDATNAVSKKELAVITRIGLDHVEYLGNTIAQIAGEKAGIMQKGAPAVFLASDRESSAVFVERARKLGIEVYSLSENDYAFLEFHNKNIDFSLRTEYYGYVGLKLNTIARYQMENAALAVRAIEVLDKGAVITAQNIAEGISKCTWQGRMEELFPEVYADGAHNEDGIRAFLETVRQDGCEEGRLLLFSAVSDKDYEHMIKRVAESGLFDKIAIAHMRTTRAAETDSLKELFDRYPQCSCDLYTDAGTALAALRSAQGRGRIYIAGSLYLVGEIKESLKV